MKVNSYLNDWSESNDTPFILVTQLHPPKHLNNSQIHLNPKGSRKLRDNCVRYLKGLSSGGTAKQN